MDAKSRDVVYHLQIALTVLLGGTVAIDGLLGPETREAYASLSERERATVDEFIVDKSPFLRDRLGANFSSSIDTARYDRDEVELALEEAATRLDVPRSYLDLALKYENWVSMLEVKTSVAGTFRGIGQFGKNTWGTIVSRYPELGLSDWEDGVLSLRQSALATAALYLENKKSFEAQFPVRKYSDAIAYLFHQQGAPAAARFLRTGDLVYPEQSKNSIALFRKVYASALS